MDMNKRAVELFILFILCSVGLVCSQLTILADEKYTDVALSQSSYIVEISKTRGRIYDCKMRSLAGGRLCYKALVLPSSASIAHLSRVLEGEELAKLDSRLTGRSPFVVEAQDATIEGDGVTVFRTEKRYAKNVVAPHIVGYLDSEGRGASGAELAFDEYLDSASGALTALCTVNARGSGLEGVEPVITDTSDNSKAGVVLSIDRDIQYICEQAASLYFDKGAIVVLELPSCEIRACVSVPDFEPDNIAAYLESEDAPLINRALSAYDLGSVFKLAVAAAALENGIAAENEYECSGNIEIGENVFHCSKREGHGVIDMETALAVSCNCYFIDLATQLGADEICAYAKSFGFGKSIDLLSTMSASAGKLPESEAAQYPAALANLAIGQGKLMASPLQIAKLTAAIANKGIVTEPKLYLRAVDVSGAATDEADESKAHRAISESTALKISAFMRSAALEGTAKPGLSDKTTVAAKTGTAETGIMVNGAYISQAWFAGFFPYESPKYVCVVLVEGGSAGGSSAGPVFRYIADLIS